ncbi:response regulator transcription factor [soil metagenome]
MRTLIVDDHEIAREGLRSAFRSNDCITIVGLAADATQAAEVARTQSPDLAIIDLNLPGISGDVLCRTLISEHPGLFVIILSSYLNDDAVRRSYASGAAAYVTKAAGMSELRSAIERIRMGDRSGSTGVAQTVERLDELVAARSSDNRPSAHQTHILECIASGMTYREIADHLYISTSTVRYHVQNLKVKLGVHSRTQLVVSGIEFGIISAGPDFFGGKSE